MHGVGPGSLLGGRYLVHQRVAAHPRFERWTASDQALERDVVLLCFDARSGMAPAVLDAARRAAGVEERRLVRVLDVGAGPGRSSGPTGSTGTKVTEAVSYVVEEPVPGARTVAALLADGGLPADEARRLAGEAAAALESARARGLHHLLLTPRSVLQLPDGAVKVRGLATEAALLEVDDLDSAAASRTDAVALVALAYAGLTGRWPLADSGSAHGTDPGIEAALRVRGGVALPSEQVAGVPPDLDLVIRRTLNEEAGPATPGELAEQLRPWSATPAIGILHPASRSQPTSAALGGTVDRGATVAKGGGASAVATEPLARDPRTGGLATVPNGPPGSKGSAPSKGPLATDPAGPADPAKPDDRDETSAATPLAGVGAAVGAGVGAAAGLAGSAGSKLGKKVSALARSAADRSAERAASRAQQRETEQAQEGALFEDDDHVRLSDTLETTEDTEPEPLIGGASPPPPIDRDQSRLALLIVGAFVLVAALLGVWGLPKLSGIGQVSDTPAATMTVTATTSAPDAAAPPPATSAPAAGAPIPIASGSQLDLENGGVQASRTAVLAFDGNPDTVWRSSKWYATADFGGFPKKGVGLLLDLGASKDVHQVAFTTRGAADVTVYVSGQPTIDGATALGSVKGQDGPATVTAPGGSANGRYVIVWFTSLGPDGEGHFRAQLAEVTVS